MAISILDLYQTKPSEDRVWRFSPNTKTFLQTDSDQKGNVRWYLTHSEGGNPARYMEIEENPASVLSALRHYGDKSWCDRTQLLDALMPAIRAIF
jgi:hypothetical protein